VFDSEFSKGKTKAVLDAAGKALSLIDRDSTIGIEASKSIKHVGLENVLKIQSICFQAPVDSLASSCINMSVNASIMGSDEIKTLPFHACLNKELVPRMARFLANYLFPDIGSNKQKRSLVSEEKDPIPEDGGRLTAFLRGRGLLRRAREVETADERENIEPFWDLIQQHDPLKEAKKTSPPSHPSMGNLKRKWKIPGLLFEVCEIIDHSFIQSFIHSFIHSFVRSFVLSIFLSFVYSHSLVSSFVHSLNYYVNDVSFAHHTSDAKSLIKDSLLFRPINIAGGSWIFKKWFQFSRPPAAARCFEYFCFF